MKNTFLITLLLLTYNTLYCQTVIVSDNTWKGVGSSITAGAGWNAQGYNDSGWPLVDAPNAANVIPVVPGSMSMWCLPYTDTAFMRKTFYIPVGDSYTGSISINADNEFDLYFNGTNLGFFNNWMGGPYTFNISPSLQGCVQNVVAVRAVNWSGPNGASLSTTLTVLNPLNTPVANPPTNITCTSFTANWDTVATAQHYLLDVSDNAAFSTFFSVFMNFNVGNVNSYNVTGLTPGITYYYRVRAVRNALTSCYSNSIVYSPAFQFSASTNSPVCEGENLFLFANNNIPGGIAGWTGPNGFASATDTVSLGTATLNLSGNYIYTVNIPGCNPVDDTVEVIVNPEYNISIDTGFCDGNSLLLHGQWVAASGIYPFNLVTISGCDSMRTYNVQQFNAYDTSYITTSICYDEVYTLPDGNTTAQAGAYYFPMITNHGCDSTVKVTVHILPVDSCVFIIPNVISPNGDGMNDFFFIKGLTEPGVSLKIFDRWGDLIYLTDDYKNNWGGEAGNGKKLSDGVYFYLVTSPKKGVFNGFVHVLGK